MQHVGSCQRQTYISASNTGVRVDYLKKIWSLSCTPHMLYPISTTICQNTGGFGFGIVFWILVLVFTGGVVLGQFSWIVGYALFFFVGLEGPI